MNDFSQARKNMVDCQIHPSGVLTPAILDAFQTVPREKFIPAPLAGIAYHDEDIALGNRRFLLAPALLARMVEAAQPQPSDIILDIGGTFGYMAFIFSQLTAHVTALEDRADYTLALQSTLQSYNIKNVTPVTGDLASGFPQNGPYDLIFLNGAVSGNLEKLAGQLKPNGRLIGIFKENDRAVAQAVIMRRSQNGELSSYPLFETSSGYLPGYEPKTTFNFG